MVQISHKLLHLAATNCEDGGHYNTKWRIFWNLVTQKRRWLEESMAQSALGASNRGFVFKFQEFRTLSNVTGGARPAVSSWSQHYSVYMGGP